MRATIGHSATLLMVAVTCGLARGQEPLLEKVAAGVKGTVSRLGTSLQGSFRLHTVAAPVPGGLGGQATPTKYTVAVFDDNVLVVEGDGSTGGGRQNTASKAQAATPKGKSTTAQSYAKFDTPTVTGRNSRYAFKLSKGESGPSWLLTGLGRLGQPEASDIETTLQRHRRDAAESVDSVSTVDGTQKLTKLFDLDGFKLVQITQADTNGPVTVKFTRALSRVPGQAIDCQYTFDPSRGWLPTAWSETITAPSVTRTLRVSREIEIGEYKYDVNSTITETTTKPEPRTTTMNARCVIESNPGASESDFTLAAYGLTEPADLASQTSRRYLWLLAAAVASFGLMLLFRWLARRNV